MRTVRKSNIGVCEIKKVFQGLLPSKIIIFFSIILLLAENGIVVGLPYVTMQFIDKMNLKNVDLHVILGIAIAFIIQLILAAASAYALTYISEYLISGLRRRVIKKILNLPVLFYDQNKTGDIMSRVINDTMIIKEFIAEDANLFFSNMISLVGSVILLLIIDWKVGIRVIVMIPLTSVVVSAVAEREYGVSVSLQEETANFQSLLNKIISDIRLVKSYVAEKFEYDNCNSVISELYALSLKEGKIMATIRPFSNSIMLLLVVTIFGYGSLRVAQGTLTAGGLIAVIMYLFQMSSPASGIASFYTGYQKFCGAIKRLCEIDDYAIEEVKISESYENCNKGLLFENVYFRYSDSKEVIKNISFEIELGKSTALIGPSGVGKTTIFSLIERFYLPTSGNIYYNGKNISQYEVEQWRRKIAYVSQESSIMYGTILSNLTYGMETYTKEQVDWAVEQAKLKDYIETLPDKYNTEVGERGVKLSGGQRQRLAIARAMIRDPEILLLDEATSHLDSDSERLVKESLDVLMKGRTTLIIAHNLSTVKDVDKLIVFEEGKITGIGNHEELIATHLLYQRFIEQQSCDKKEIIL